MVILCTVSSPNVLTVRRAVRTWERNHLPILQNSYRPHYINWQSSSLNKSRNTFLMSLTCRLARDFLLTANLLIISNVYQSIWAFMKPWRKPRPVFLLFGSDADSPSSAVLTTRSYLWGRRPSDETCCFSEGKHTKYQYPSPKPSEMVPQTTSGGRCRSIHGLAHIGRRKSRMNRPHQPNQRHRIQGMQNICNRGEPSAPLTPSRRLWNLLKEKFGCDCGIFMWSGGRLRDLQCPMEATGHLPEVLANKKTCRTGYMLKFSSLKS